MSQIVRTFALITLALSCVSATSMNLAHWEVEYQSSSGIFPDGNNDGWNFYTRGDYQSGFVNNALWLNTMVANAGDASGWQNARGSFDFGSGFVMEARVRMINSTDYYQRWGGAELYSRSRTGLNLSIDLDPDEVILGSIFGFVTYTMNTVDQFHTYRAEALNNIGYLYIDGNLKSSIALQKDNADGFLWFGDQGWEGGNMYYEYVRYGSLVPELPIWMLILVSAIPLSLARRRV